MKKQAIIIVTPNCPKHDHLPGATKDAEAWKDFLLSPEGGAWNEDEIRILSDCSKSHVDLVLETHKMKALDYSLLAFSGHGFYKKLPDNSTETRMLLSETDYLTESTLTVRARRELVIMDACRQYGGEVIEEMAKIATFSNAQVVRAEDRFAKARAMYESALSLSPEGRTLIFSCSLNQTAADKASFSRFLISDAERLARAAATIRTVSVKEAFDAAESKPLKDNYPQKPTYDGGRRVTHFPFSVSL